MDLYVQIFSFLEVVLEWYGQRTWKRGLQSMSDRYIDDFRKPLDRIKAFRRRIEEGLQQGAAAETRALRIEGSTDRRIVINAAEQMEAMRLENAEWRADQQRQRLADKAEQEQRQKLLYEQFISFAQHQQRFLSTEGGPQQTSQMETTKSSPANNVICANIEECRRKFCDGSARVWTNLSRQSLVSF